MSETKKEIPRPDPRAFEVQRDFRENPDPCPGAPIKPKRSHSPILFKPIPFNLSGKINE